MALQPRLHVGMLVGAVIVHHQVERDLAGKLRIKASQEFQELLMAVPGKALPDHFPLQDLQGREQARGAMALVVVGHRPQTALLQGQSRLRAVQGLDLGLLVHAEHKGVVRGVQVQPHHIGELLQKPRIARKLEALDAVRLQVVAAPDSADRGFAHALRVRHLSATPLRHPSRLGQQRRLDNRLDLARRVAGLASTAWRNRPQPFRARLGKSPAPQCDRFHINSTLSRNPQIRSSSCGRQHDPAAQRHLLRRAVCRHPALQLLPLSIAKTHHWASSGHASA